MSLAVFQRQMLGDKRIQHNVEVSKCLPSPGGECPLHGKLGRDTDRRLLAELGQSPKTAQLTRRHKTSPLKKPLIRRY